MSKHTDQDEARKIGDRVAPPTTPDRETIAEDRREAGSSHDADRPPTDEEARKAEESGDVSDDVSASYQAANERGANTEGEGRIVP